MTHEEEAQLEDWEQVSSQQAVRATRRVLEEVALERRLEDDRDGAFRDYADTNAGALALWNDRQQQEALHTAYNGLRPWLAQLFVAVGYVAAVLRDKRMTKLRPALLKVACVCVAWAEALDVRNDEKRAALALQPKRTLWQRFLAFLRRKTGGVAL